MSNRCAICLEYGNTISNVCSCNSTFHTFCITKWITEYNNSCPVCRSIIGNTRVETINNQENTIYFRCKLLLYLMCIWILVFYFYINLPL